jgi:hypothetical protein
MWIPLPEIPNFENGHCGLEMLICLTFSLLTIALEATHHAPPRFARSWLCAEAASYLALIGLSTQDI